MPGYSQSICKYCGAVIFWRIVTRYFDTLGDLRNHNHPKNADESIHDCPEYGQRKRKALLQLEEVL
jgi:hypothetical protein